MTGLERRACRKARAKARNRSAIRHAALGKAIGAGPAPAHKRKHGLESHWSKRQNKVGAASQPASSPQHVHWKKKPRNALSPCAPIGHIGCPFRVRSVSLVPIHILAMSPRHNIRECFMAEILVVEDYPPMASLVTMVLRSQGHQVTREMTVAGALRHDRSFAYAVLDIDLPDGSGVALAEQLRRRVSSIVFFTATRDATTLSSAAELGIVVNKAEGPNQLLYVIQQLEIRRGHSSTARPRDALQPSDRGYGRCVGRSAAGAMCMSLDS